MSVNHEHELLLQRLLLPRERKVLQQEGAHAHRGEPHRPRHPGQHHLCLRHGKVLEVRHFLPINNSHGRFSFAGRSRSKRPSTSPPT